MRQTIQQALILEGAPFKSDPPTPQEKEEFDTHVLDWIAKNHKNFGIVFEEYQKRIPTCLRTGSMTPLK